MSIGSVPGTLIFVVGPSGVGKDTLIDGAKALYAGDSRFRFLRREITRPAEAGGEDHIPISRGAFETRKQAGHYVFSWGAHELQYGVTRDQLDPLDQGCSVIVNASRSIIPDVRKAFPGLCVLSINASESVLEKRLIERGREDSDDIRRRIDRASAFTVSGSDVIEICNDGTPEEGIAKFALAMAQADGRIFGRPLPEKKLYMPRRGAYLLANHGDEVLFVQDANSPLMLPGGGVDNGETHEEALQREVMEETGGSISSSLRHLCDVSVYHDHLGQESWHKVNRYFTGEVEIPDGQRVSEHLIKWANPKTIWDQLHPGFKHVLARAGLA